MLVVQHSGNLDQQSYVPIAGPVNTGLGDCEQVNRPGQLNLFL